MLCALKITPSPVEGSSSEPATEIPGCFAPGLLISERPQASDQASLCSWYNPHQPAFRPSGPFHTYQRPLGLCTCNSSDQPPTRPIIPQGLIQLSPLRKALRDQVSMVSLPL